ncbi:MAG: fimbrial protein [Chania sp.]
MNKLLAVSAFALAVTPYAAVAANGEVQFLGVVTDTTCDILPIVGGGTVNNLVQLGTVGTNATGIDVPFALKADMNQSGCQNLTAASTATIGWNGAFDINGLKAQSGVAADAWASIDTVNASITPVQGINSTNLSADFTGDVLTTTGAMFKATLHGGAIAGDYRSVAAFVVAYN